ncbi:MAG: hypothetical protein L0H23_04775 [Luteimonas sp.]|nr:hypothetical protein [Luteimonas sp.]
MRIPLKPVLLLLSIAAVSTATQAAHPTPVVNQGDATHEDAAALLVQDSNQGIGIGNATATIRSQSDLSEYLQATPIARTPLGKLSPGAQRRFLGSLTFNEKGLTGFDYRALSDELSASEIHQVLGLFEMQRTTALIPGLRIETPVDEAIMRHVSPQESTIGHQLEEMRALDGRLSGRGADAERFRRLAEFYRARFSGLQAPDIRAAMSDEDLRALTLAAQLAVFYHHDDDILDDAMADLRMLEDRGAARPGDIHATYALLVAGRRFEQARHFLAAHPDLDEPEPPRLLGLRADVSGAAEMRVGEVEGTLVWAPVDLTQLPRILVIGHPSCHFTQDAAHAIEADPALRNLFAAHAKWLAPQDTGTDFTVFRRWNTEHPDLPITIAYRAAGFPMIDHWATPTFYFVDHGRVVSKVIGWPRGGRREEILAAYREAFPDTAPSSER